MANYDETLDAAARQANKQLNDLLESLRADWAKVPEQHRFEFVMLKARDLNIDPFTAWTALALAAGRIVFLESELAALHHHE